MGRMCDYGWRILSEESLCKRILICDYLASGRYYQLIAAITEVVPGNGG